MSPVHDVSIAYARHNGRIQHAALSTDEVLAWCGIWHEDEDEECPVASGWVLMMEHIAGHRDEFRD